jgi:hypothetical protein
MAEVSNAELLVRSSKGFTDNNVRGPIIIYDKLSIKALEENKNEDARLNDENY